MTISTTPVLIVGTDYSDFPDGRSIAVGEGLAVVDSGPQSRYTIYPGGRLTSVATNTTTGYLSYNSLTREYTSRSINGTFGIKVEVGEGLGGNTLISQIPETVIQRINVANGAGEILGNYSNVEFRAGDNISVTVTDQGLGARAIVTISNTGPRTGTVTSVDAASSTGLIVAGGPVTSTGTITINLPGSGLDSVINDGDMLLGNFGAYIPIPIGASNSVWTSNGTSASWQILSGTGTVTSVDADSTTGLLVSGGPITTDGIINVELPGSASFQAVASGDLLVGGGSGAYTPLEIGPATSVLTSDGTNCSWAAIPTPPAGTVTSVGISSSNAFITVDNSPITSSGTISLTIGTLPIVLGGTGRTTATTAFAALAPTTTTGDMIFASSGPICSRLPIGSVRQVITPITGVPQYDYPENILPGTGPSDAVVTGDLLVGTTGSYFPIAIGSAGKVLTSDGTLCSWQAVAGTGTVTFVDAISSTGLLVSGGAITSSGTFNIAIPGTGVANAVVSGDLLVGAPGFYTPLQIGAVNQVLTSNGTTCAWAALPPTGTVTSVGLSSSDSFITITGSPVTTSGTLAMTINTLPINHGGTGQISKTASFDALAPTSALGDTIYYNGTNNVRRAIGTTGQVYTVAGGVPTWATPTNTGTVTSVGLSSSDGFITVSGSPVTTSGTLAMTINTLPINKGGTGQISKTSSFGALAPTTTDGDLIYYFAGTNFRLPIGTVGTVLKSTGSVPAWSTTGTVTSVALTSSNAFITVSGSPINNSGTFSMTINTLPINKGGTGQTSKTAGFDSLAPTNAIGDTIYYNGTNNIRLARGTPGQVYTVDGSIPSWTSTNQNSGAATTVGLATGVTGTTTINTTAVTASSIILLSLSSVAGAGITLAPIVTAPSASIVAGTSFQIIVSLVGGAGQATSVDVYWQIVNPN